MDDMDERGRPLPPNDVRRFSTRCKGTPHGIRCIVMVPRTKESGLCYGCERDLYRMKP